MAISLHEAAPHHLPPFITAPGQADVLYIVVVVSLIGVVLLVGNFYFKLHALPEQMAHGADSAQFQLVGVLALLALFTHNNIFWVAALLLAALRMPDFTTPLNAIARSVGALSDRLDRPEALAPAAPPPAPAAAAAATAAPDDPVAAGSAPVLPAPDDAPAPQPSDPPSGPPAPDANRR